MKNFSFKKIRENESGVAAIEFGMLFPFFFLLFLGLVDVTGYISLSRKATNAAAVVGDLVAQENGTTSTTVINDYLESLGIMFFERPKDVRAFVENYRRDPVSGNISRVWNHSNGLNAAGCTGGAPPTTTLLPLMGDANDVIVARVCLTYKPTLKFLKVAEFKIEEISLVRPRSSKLLACASCPQG